MRKLVIVALLAIASPALAAKLSKVTIPGTTMQEMRTKLTGIGYQVRKSEMEDGKIAAHFVKGDKMGEAYVTQQRANSQS